MAQVSPEEARSYTAGLRWSRSPSAAPELVAKLAQEAGQQGLLRVAEADVQEKSRVTIRASSALSVKRLQ